MMTQRQEFSKHRSTAFILHEHDGTYVIFIQMIKIEYTSRSRTYGPTQRVQKLQSYKLQGTICEKCLNLPVMIARKDLGGVLLSPQSPGLKCVSQ